MRPPSSLLVGEFSAPRWFPSRTNLPEALGGRAPAIFFYARTRSLNSRKVRFRQIYSVLAGQRPSGLNAISLAVDGRRSTRRGLIPVSAPGKADVRRPAPVADVRGAPFYAVGLTLLKAQSGRPAQTARMSTGSEPWIREPTNRC